MNWLFLLLALWPHTDGLNHHSRLAAWEVGGRRGPEAQADIEDPDPDTWYIRTGPGKSPRRVR